MVEEHELVVEELGCVVTGYGSDGTVKDKRECELKVAEDLKFILKEKKTLRALKVICRL
jgi:hypothetical protein